MQKFTKLIMAYHLISKHENCLQW